MKPDEYDVFLSYNGDDEAAVEELARRLQDAGLRIFFAPWHLVPGVPWLLGLEGALKRSQSCAIFLGPQGRGPWQDEEMFTALQLAMLRERAYRVIPVLLPGADPADANTVPLFLRSRTWIDFRPGLEDAAALHRLRCGVLGIEPGDVGGTVDMPTESIPPVRPPPIPSLVGRPIQFYSCFISYSSKDQDAADRLHADLQRKGVPCWFAPEDMKIGDRIRQRIDEEIRRHDKLLLILSQHSIHSDWVENEVETALEEERRRKRTVLFPIRLDETVMATDQAWAADIRRTRHIGDFRRWKDHGAYQRAFSRLVHDLEREEG